MIEVHKLLTGKEQVDYKQFFTLADTPYVLRGHLKNLAKGRSKLDSRKKENFSSDKEWSIDGMGSQQKS